MQGSPSEFPGKLLFGLQAALFAWSATTCRKAILCGINGKWLRRHLAKRMCQLTVLYGLQVTEWPVSISIKFFDTSSTAVDTTR